MLFHIYVHIWIYNKRLPYFFEILFPFISSIAILWYFIWLLRAICDNNLKNTWLFQLNFVLKSGFKEAYFYSQLTLARCISLYLLLYPCLDYRIDFYCLNKTYALEAKNFFFFTVVISFQHCSYISWGFDYWHCYYHWIFYQPE